MKREHRALIAIITLYTLIRIYLATQSAYGYYHGWNEGYYSLIAKNYFTGSLWYPTAYNNSLSTSVPPLFSYLLHTSLNLFGTSDLSARLVSILSEILATAGVYLLAKTLYNKRIAQTAAIIFLLIPWNILWFGRAQTDPLMTALMTLGIALYVYAYKNNKTMLPSGIALGLAVFTKQPALAALPLLLIWSYTQGIKKHRVTAFLTSLLIGLLPLLLWLTYHALQGNPAAESLFYSELAHRSAPFEDLPRVTLATGFGITPLILALSIYSLLKHKTNTTLLILWLLIYGAFVAIRTPLSHEYYSLPLMPPISILAATGMAKITRKYNINHTLLLTAVLLTTLPFTYTLLSYTGDMGYTNTEDMAAYINQLDEDPLLFIPVKYTPQMYWYTHNATIYSIGDQSLDKLEDISEQQKTKTYLLIDEKDFRHRSAEEKYNRVYTREYHTSIDPSYIPAEMILYNMTQ